MSQTFSKNMVLVTVILMDLLAGMEFDLFVPSFPELQKLFNLSPFWVEALLSVNFVGYCLSLFLVGALADRYGRKPLILIGLFIFIAGSILCLWAPSYPILLIGRFLQGIGVAAPAMLSFLIISDSYPLKQQQYLLAMLNGLMNASVAIAPILGSYITMHFHWQGNFSALLLLGVAVLVMTMLFIPNSKLVENNEATSLRGYINIFESRPLVLVIVSFTFMFVPYWIFVGVSPLLYMKDLGVSLSHFGYYQGGLALIFGFGSMGYGLVIGMYDKKRMIFLSGVMWIVSLVMIALILNTRNPLLITFSLLPFVIGEIVPTTVLYPICLTIMPQAKGRITAIISAGRLILASLGLQLAGYYYGGSFKSIGIILSCFIVPSIVALVFVLRNKELTKLSKEQ